MEPASIRIDIHRRLGRKLNTSLLETETIHKVALLLALEFYFARFRTRRDSISRLELAVQ
jgi:hypothetical protein